MTTPRKTESFTALIFLWLKQVAADREVTPAAVRVAFWISQHVNRRTHDAWPSEARLATLSCMSVRSVRRALDTLCDAGHVRKQVGHGPHMSNHYRLTRAEKRTPMSPFPEPEKGTTMSSFAEKRTSTPRKADKSDAKSGQPCPTNHHNEPAYENHSANQRRADARIDNGFDENHWPLDPVERRAAYLQVADAIIGESARPLALRLLELKGDVDPASVVLMQSLDAPDSRKYVEQIVQRCGLH